MRYGATMALTLALISMFLGLPAFADVPGQINHQGVVKVNGVPFDGTGLFRFAIVDPDAPKNLWSNDGSITDATGGHPHGRGERARLRRRLHGGAGRHESREHD